MKYYVVEIHTGDFISKAYHNRNGAEAYCEELNHHAGGPAYRVQAV